MRRKERKEKELVKKKRGRKGRQDPFFSFF